MKKGFKKTAPEAVKERLRKLPKKTETIAVKPKVSKTASKPKISAKKKVKSVPRQKRLSQAEEIKIEMRRQRILDLVTKYAMTVRDISEILKKEGHKASIGTVHSDLTTILNEVAETRQLSAEHWNTIIVGRLEDQYAATMNSMIIKRQGQSVLEADPEKQRLLLSILDRLDRHVGASKRERNLANAPTLLAQLLGVSPDELPNGSEREE